MTIDYRKIGKVQFSMKHNIKTLLEEAPYDMNGTAKTPAANTCSTSMMAQRIWHMMKQNYSTTWWQNYYTYAEGHVRTYKTL